MNAYTWPRQTAGTVLYQRHRKRIVILIVSCLLFTGFDAYAEQEKESRGTLQPEPVDVNENQTWQTNASKMLGATHTQMSKSVKDFAARIDTFLANDRSLEEEKGDRLRLRLISRFDENGKASFKQHVSIHLKLPKIRKRFMLVLEELGEGDQLDDIKKEDNIEKLNAVFRLILHETEHERLDFDSGMSFKPAPNPIGRVRYRIDIHLGQWNFRPTQVIYWKLDDGFGETSRLDLERHLFDLDLLRFTEEVTWSEVSSGVEFITTAAYLRTFSDLAACGLFFNIFAHTRPSAMIDSYRLNFTYRRAIYKHWIYFQVEPVLEAPQDKDYRIVPSIYFMLETSFP